MFLGSLVVSADCQRIRMIWRKMNGANVVLIYLKYAYYAWLKLCRFDYIRVSDGESQKKETMLWLSYAPALQHAPALASCKHRDLTPCFRSHL